MEKLKLINGKFYRGKEEVPLEIGNVEMIDLIKKAERDAEKAETQGIECDFMATNIRYDNEISFTCFCGHKIEESDTCYDEYDEDDLDSEWENDIIKCKKCGKQYVINNGYAKLKNK